MQQGVGSSLVKQLEPSLTFQSHTNLRKIVVYLQEKSDIISKMKRRMQEMLTPALLHVKLAK